MHYDYYSAYRLTDCGNALITSIPALNSADCNACKVIVCSLLNLL